MANRGSAARALPEQAEEMNSEERVGRLEVAVQHIQADIAELKTDVRELRNDVKAIRAEFSADIQTLRGEIHAQGTTLGGEINALKLAFERMNTRMWIGFAILFTTQILTAGPAAGALARLLR